MKKMNHWLKTQPETIVVMLGLGTGLGLAVHEVFFVVPLVITLVLAIEWTGEKTYEYLRRFHSRPRHP